MVRGKRELNYSLSILAGVTVVLGAHGFASAPNHGNPLDIAFNTVNLFFLNYGGPLSPPPTLEAARWTGMAATAMAAFRVFLEAVGRLRRLRKAFRTSGHTVVVGSSPDAIRLAQSLGDKKRKVVLVGSTDETTAHDLRKCGVLVVSEERPESLERVVQGAAKVIVRAPNDAETARLAERIVSWDLLPGSRVNAMFTRREFTNEWNRRAGEVTALCSSTQLAVELLRRCPPRLHEAVAADPVVVAEGQDGTELVRQLVLGWQEPGESMRVHVVGSDLRWAREAADSLGTRAEVIEHDLTATPESVGRVVREVLRLQEPIDTNKGVTAGPAVYIVLPEAESVRAVPLASSVSAAVKQARVCALVEQTARWQKFLMGGDHSPLLVSRHEVLCDLSVLSAGPEKLLQRELLRDASAWRDELGSVFGQLQRDEEGAVTWEAQSAACRAAIEAVAASVATILAAGNIELTPVVSSRDEFILSNPDELVAMAAVLQTKLPTSPDEGAGQMRVDLSETGVVASFPALAARGWSADRQRALELAARLPVLAARSGWAPARQRGANALTDRQIHRLAIAVHEAYQLDMKELGNPTNSEAADLAWDQLSRNLQSSNRAQVLGIPVKLAAAGLTWQPSENPVVTEFSDELLVELAQLEHRRWVHHEVCNGRARHGCNKLWADLPDNTAQLDLRPVKRIPQMLGECGLEMVPAGSSSRPSDGGVR